MRKLAIALGLLTVSSLSASALAAPGGVPGRPATPGNSAARPAGIVSSVLRATADEVRLINDLKTQITNKYAEIGRIRAANVGKVASIFGLYAQINSLRDQINRLAGEALKVGACNIAIKAYDARTTLLTANVARMTREVAQDASELKTSEELYNKQKALCDAKRRNGENASEIASCDRTASLLQAQVTAERADKARAQAGLNAANMARTAHLNANSRLATCRALVANPPATAAAAAALRTQMNAKFAEIERVRGEIAANNTRIDNLYKEIAALNVRIAATRAEAAQDAVCALKIKAWDDKAASLANHVDNMLKEVNQDRNELSATESIYNAQKALCARKVANRENASEIASCNATADILKGNVDKEKVDLAESTRAHSAATTAKAAHAATSNQLNACRAAVRN